MSGAAVGLTTRPEPTKAAAGGRRRLFLFLALGFLKWKKHAGDSRLYRAPLVLLPVRLERRSALSGVTIVDSRSGAPGSTIDGTSTGLPCHAS